MIRFARDFRLIPIVLLATISLFALKVSGLVFDGGYTLAERIQNQFKPELKTATPESVPEFPKIIVDGKQVSPEAAPSRQVAAQAAKRSWAQEMFNYSDTGRVDVTGSAGSADKKEEKPAEPPLKVSNKPPAPPKLEVGDVTVPIAPGGRIASPGERAILERLQGRRKDLESRSNELDMRESLLKAAEKRLEAKVAELKGVETRVNTVMGNRDQLEAKRLKSIVEMYENMKPKEAARIFERLDMKILVDVSIQINPRKMSEILAQMTPDAAERLTVELARRATGLPKSQKLDELPKIEGKPNGPG
jgi:flagellar motility protein MotE (MotC chaperone)